MGGCIATAPVLLLWPRYEREVILNAASAAMRSLATLVIIPRGDPAATEPHQSAASAVKRGARTHQHPYGTPIEAGLRPTLRRIGQTLTTHLSWRSPVMHT